MLAIPIDSQSYEAKSSKLFGNVKSFAIYYPKEQKINFLTNSQSGNGIKTAKLLSQHGVNSVVYSYMGNYPFKSLQKDNINVYFIGKEPMKLSKIIEGLMQDIFVEVTDKNANEYLDPGTATASCECGCGNG